MSEIRLLKTLSGWVPASEVDAELCRGWKAGEVGVFKARKPRNGKQHRLMFALIGLVWDNLPEQYPYPNKTALLNELKFQVGHFDEHRTLAGKVTYIPKSIAYDAMSQEEFRGFFDAVLAVVQKYFLPGIEDAEIRQEIERRMNGETL